jgi:protein TonB
MNRAAVLLDHDEGLRVGSWSGAAAIVVAAHVGLVSAYALLQARPPQGAPQSPAVILELAPIPVAPASPVDLAPGPEMVEAQLPPEPQVVELPPPEPMVETPVVATPEPPPKPPEAKRVERKKPAPRSTAAPRSERRTAEVAAAPNLGSTSASAAMTSWRDRVAAQLQRQKRYPSGAEARREQGVAVLSFSVDRNGHVLSRRIARSSGYAELDQEVLALLQRAAPLPPFPPDMAQASVNLVVPIRFSLR